MSTHCAKLAFLHFIAMVMRWGAITTLGIVIFVCSSASANVQCKDGFVSVPIAETKPLQYECLPVNCNTSTKMGWGNCPGPSFGANGKAVCGISPDGKGQKFDDSLDLRKSIYKSIIEHFNIQKTQSNESASEHRFSATGSVFGIPMIDALAMTKQQVDEHPFKWNLWRNPTHDRQCDLNIDGSKKQLSEASIAANINGCSNVYTQYMLVQDPSRCWPPETGVPVLANSYTTPAQMKQCYDVVMHMLGAKPPGAYVTQPYEQRDAFLLRYPIVTCGNNHKDHITYKMVPTAENRGYPRLSKDEEGGGGTWESPWTYAESSGMCKYKPGDAENAKLKDAYKFSDAFSGKQGVRHGGTVQVEEYGHTIFDISISHFDPQGWKAVQHAAKRSRSALKRTLDSDWDCFTSATEYFAAGVELVLHNTRIGTNLRAKNRTDLWQQDPHLYCLVTRYYENNNVWRTCASGPWSSAAHPSPYGEFPSGFSTAACKEYLVELGVTKFGSEGNGMKSNLARHLPFGTGNVSVLSSRGVSTCPSSVHKTEATKSTSESGNASTWFGGLIAGFVVLIVLSIIVYFVCKPQSGIQGVVFGVISGSFSAGSKASTKAQEWRL